MSRIMNALPGLRALLCVSAALLLTACASEPLFIVDHDPTVDFSAYQTYRWYDDVYDSQAGSYRHFNSSDKRVRTYVDRELRQKGLREIPSGTADFLVNYNISREDKTKVDNIAGYPPAGVHGAAGVGTYGSGFSVGYSSGPSVKTYREGTVIIDVLDVNSQKIVWRGIAEGKLTKSLSHNEKDSLASKISKELLADFPPVQAP